MVDVVVEKNFPAANLVPKEETGVAAFLAKYPEYNGEGIIMAIFDSGVDPRSDGLQTTPDGRTKVIERHDCSGCGDVDTSLVMAMEADGILVGMSGRRLQVTDRMRRENADADGHYHLGLKGLFELYPTKVRERWLADQKLKHWDNPNKNALVDAARDLESLEELHPSPTANFLERLHKENLEQSIELLNAWDKAYPQLKPLFDCIMYQVRDGSWRVIIDTSLVGNLEEAVELGEYVLTRDIVSIAEHLSVSVNVHEDGNLLEIVGMCSSHGTHVASIASGHHPDDPALNGIAPAAKIISMTIGDSRLGSMETGAALVRAMIRVIDLCESGLRVHVINMSYGEHAHFSYSGRLGELMCEVVNKYGVVWVASAGNHGPALCTIGTPPDIVQPVFIGVGAYVSPQMLEAEYMLRHKLPSNCYTWTSRDPCIDGGQGVTVCAPGAAIASVPEFTMSKQQLMHGTSMAAPHVAGAVALLICGLLKKNIAYSPFAVKRALWNTATRLDHIDPFAQGNGLLNVERAFEALSVVHDDTLIRYAVTVGQSRKGIHIRQANPVARDYAVAVEPVFMDDQNVAPPDKINFNVRLTLVASEPWVKCGTFLDLSYMARSFVVNVDPTALPPGVHTARIRAYDTGNLAKGTVFEVPVTVVQPHVIDIARSNIFQLPAQSYKSSTITRTFLQVPAKCTWALLRLGSPNSTNMQPARFFVHTLQLVAQRYCKDYETQRLFSVTQDTQSVHAFRVVENNVLELCIAKFWSTAGVADLVASIEFRGIQTGAVAAVAAPVHVMHSACGIHRIDLTAPLPEEAAPAVQLKCAVQVLRPNETRITPLGLRDCVQDARQIYQNLLTYALHLSKAQELSIHVPLFSDVLYESEYESQMWQVSDVNKQQVACGDAYSADTFHKLEKGDYVVRLQIRHERRDLLDKVNEVNVLVTFKLAAAVSLDVYRSYTCAVRASKKCTSVPVPPNTVVPIYVALLSNDKLQKAGVPSQCSWLTGALSLIKDEAGRKLEVNNFRYILTEGPAVKKLQNGVAIGSPNAKDAPIVVPGRGKYDEFKDGVRDYKCGMLLKMELAECEMVYAELISEYPEHLLSHINMMHKLDSYLEIRNFLPCAYAVMLQTCKDVERLRRQQRRIVDMACKVVDGIDQKALLEYFGTKVDNRVDAAKIKSHMDKQRSMLIDGMIRKIIGKAKLLLMEANAKADMEIRVPMRIEVHDLFIEIGKFADYSDPKLATLTLWHGYCHQHHGRQIKVLQKLYEEKLQAIYMEEVHYLVTDHNWDHVDTLIKRQVTAANPITHRIF